MDVLALLIPVSIGLGALGLAAFVWTMKSSQYDDPAGDAARILREDYDKFPAPVAKPDPGSETRPGA